MHIVPGSRSERGEARRAPTKRVINYFCSIIFVVMSLVNEIIMDLIEFDGNFE